MQLVDLRSDTVTLPTRAMYDAMATARLGDDSLDGDPTVRLLEDEAAALLGKPASLYVPTATMANLLAVMTQSPRGRIVPMEATSHLFRVQGGAAILTGSTFEGLCGHSGAIDLDVLEAALQRGCGMTRPTMVCLESSHNHAGGAILPMDHLREIDRLARRFGCAVHLDGARLFNAAVASGIAPRALADLATTVSVCLSKGLSAPMGAILAGPIAVISAVRDLRKLLGGSQRQAGIAAAACRIAIHHMVERLAEDHRHAWQLSRRLDDIGGEFGFSVNQPQTNIVLVDVSRTGHCASAWVERLSEHGVRVRLESWAIAVRDAPSHRFGRHRVGRRCLSPERRSDAGTRGMSASGERNRIGIVAITLAMGCFGVNDALSKLASQTVPAFELIFLRSAFVALILWVVFMCRGFTSHARHLVKPAVIARGLLDAVGSVCFLIGLFNVPIATATTISMSAPLMLTLAAVALGEVVPIMRWLCTAIGFIGVLLVVQPHRDGVNVYAGLCVLGTLVNLMRDLMTRRIDRDVPSISLSAGSAIAILILTGVLAFAQGWRMPTAAGLGLIAAASVFITGGYILIVHGMQNGDLAVIAPFRYASLPLAVVLGYLIWGEAPSWLGGLGMGLILMAALQVSRRR